MADWALPVGCSDGEGMKCGGGGLTTAAFVRKDPTRGSSSPSRDDSEANLRVNELKSSWMLSRTYLLLLLRWALMSGGMVERRWEVGRLEICGLVHARAVLAWWESAGSAAAACCVARVSRTTARQTYTASVARQPLLGKIELFENFLMN